MSPLVVFLSVLASVIPLTAALLMTWWLDRYEREPLWTLGLAFAWGAFGATTLSVIAESILQLATTPFLDEEGQAVFLALAIAPPVEELLKALFLVAILFFGRWLDNVTDGVIYGVGIGLGFAMAENFGYFLKGYMEGGVGAWAFVIVFRTVFTSAMHAVATATVGALLGLGWQRASRTSTMALLGFAGYAAAVGLHVLWNGLAVLSAWTERLAFSLLGGVLILAALAFYLVVLQVALYFEHRLLRRELRGEAEQGFFPIEHVEAIASSIRRRQTDWLEPGVDQKSYIATAVRLAMARGRWRQSRGATREILARQVNELRTELARLRFGASG